MIQHDSDGIQPTEAIDMNRIVRQHRTDEIHEQSRENDRIDRQLYYTDPGYTLIDEAEGVPRSRENFSTGTLTS